jgi:S-adenosylmethionine hydrolase
MTEKYLTFLSDFGVNSSYPAQMKAVALRLTNAHIIDITHDIQPHNIREGAFVLSCTAPLFPPGTVHVGVVDPGVGTSRRGLLITTKSQIFIGPDNGLLIPAAKKIGDMHVYQLTNEKMMRFPRSKTFDGRDVFTPVAAHLLNGMAFDEVGDKISDFITLDFDSIQKSGSSIQGEVIYIDRFGNIITNIPKNMLTNHPSENAIIEFSFGKKSYKIPFVPSYGHVSLNQMLATIGSNDFFEISINQGNAAEELKVKPGSLVSINFL